MVRFDPGLYPGFGFVSLRLYFQEEVDRREAIAHIIPSRIKVYNSMTAYIKKS